MSADVLFLDSADLGDAAVAAASGIVSGITTNPTILRRSLADGVDAIAHLEYLLAVFPAGPVFHQLTSGDALLAEGEVAALVERLAPHLDRLVFKLPAQPWLYALGAQLVGRGLRVAYTAVYTPGQVVAARQAGAEWVIPYVDRARRLRPEPGDLLPALRTMAGSATRILAASVKSPDQAVAALASGADAVTAPWEVLHGLMADPLTDSAVAEFAAVTGAAR